MDSKTSPIACAGAFVSGPAPLRLGDRFAPSSHCLVSGGRPLKCRPTTAPSRAVTPARMMGEDAEPVEDPLASPDFLTRVRAINDHRQRAPAQVIAALVPLASSDKNPQIRYSAISQLAGLDRTELTDEEKATLLQTSIEMIKNDTDSSWQSGAADVIAGLGLTDGFETLVSTFNETTDWMLKLTIAAGMGEIGDPRASDFLKGEVERAEGEGNELLLTAIIGALGDIRDPDGLPVIERFLEHPDVSIRQRAAIAVELIRNP
jgi:HEAT repeat protein